MSGVLKSTEEEIKTSPRVKKVDGLKERILNKSKY